FLITLLLITGYYLLFTIGAGLARQGTIPVWVGIWCANVLTAALGLFLLPRLERMPGSGRQGGAWSWLTSSRIGNVFARGDRASSVTNGNGASSVTNGNGAGIFSIHKRRSAIPQLLDMYLLRSFFYYFVLLTVGFILLFEFFTFFELLDDIAQHRT